MIKEVSLLVVQGTDGDVIIHSVIDDVHIAYILNQLNDYACKSWILSARINLDNGKGSIFPHSGFELDDLVIPPSQDVPF